MASKLLDKLEALLEAHRGTDDEERLLRVAVTAAQAAAREVVKEAMAASADPRGRAMIRYRPDIDRGGAMIRYRPDSPRGGAMIRYRPDSPRGGAMIRYRPDSPRGGPMIRYRPDSPRGGAMIRYRPDSPRSAEDVSEDQLESLVESLARGLGPDEARKLLTRVMSKAGLDAESNKPGG